MGLKNRLFLIFIILMVLLSVSVVCASENTTVEQTDELEPLSAVEPPTEIDTSPEIDESSNISNRESLTVDESTNGQHQKNNVLGASNEGETPLRAAATISMSDYITQNGLAYNFNAIQQAFNSIKNNADGGTIYLDGGYYRNIDTRLILESNYNIKIYGGTQDYPELTATLDGNNVNAFFFVFNGVDIHNVNLINLKSEGSDYNNFHANIQSNGNVNFDNCHFENFIGTYECIRLQGITTFKNCTFNNFKGNDYLIHNFGNSSFYDCNLTNFATAPTPLQFEEHDTSNNICRGNFVGCHFENITATRDIRFSNTNITNSIFEKIESTENLFFITDECLIENTLFNNCKSKEHVFVIWSSSNTKFIKILYCNFTNSEATFSNTLTTDSGQFAVLFGCIMDHCNFINTTNKHHGGAFCVYDDANYTTNTISSKITNCNFININTWSAAVYIHGKSAGRVKDEVLIENCSFINCNSSTWSGALGISHDNTIVNNCKFINNTAKQGSAIMIGGIAKMPAFDGDNTNGHHVTISNCYFEGNVATNENIINGDSNYTTNGGAIFIQGNYNTILNCTFVDNAAKKGDGAAIYAHGINTEVINSVFYNHTCTQGTVYIEGNNAKVSNSTFENNTATNGAGVFIKGASAVIENNNFTNNNATGKGGACYIGGDYSRFTGNDFTYNNAIPQANNDDVGLGGAIYVKGSNTQSISNSFEFNTARNGSAVYTDGNNFNLVNDKFFKNQAFSYFLVTTAEPEDSIHKTSDVLVTIVHVGGDNILNAIHNTQPFNQIKFQNVTYIDFYGNNKTTGSGMTIPLDGPLNSNNGTHVYQYDREAYQDVHIVITHEDGTVRYDDTLKTDINGTVTLNLDKLSLKPGNYSVYAEHPEDWNYKFIMNTTSFRINAIPVTPGKTVSNPTPNYGDIITYNLTVKNTADVVYSDNISFRRHENV